MISITCTNCESVLTIDDAFAGGVCRCQFCGTIQTVPSKSGGTLQPAAASRALYQKTVGPSQPGAARTEAPGTGLEELGSSSGTGLSSHQLENEPTSPTAAASAPVLPDKPPLGQPMRLSIVVVSAAVVVMVGLVITMLALRSGRSTSGSGSSIMSTAGVAGADFCGLPIKAGSVIFILDRGNSINDSFDALKAACFKSLKQLGPDRKFQVIFWDRDTGSAEFPSGGMRNATAGAIEDCQRDFQDVVAGGRTHLVGALREAIDRKPQLIVVASAKPQLDEDDAAALSSAITAGVRIDFLQVGSASTTTAVTDVTHSTGGQLKTISTAELQALSR